MFACEDQRGGALRFRGYDEIKRLDREKKFELYKRFEDPATAVGILAPRLFEVDAGFSFSTTIIDNATVHHGFRYFDSVIDNPRPDIRRLTLLSVAELINALILSDTIITGPAPSSVRVGMSPLLRTARELVRPIGDRLTPAELFAVVSLAKHETLRLVKSPTFDASFLVGPSEVPLDHSKLEMLVSRITPRASQHSPHLIQGEVDNPNYYYYDFVAGILGPTATELGIADYMHEGRRQENQHDHERQFLNIKRGVPPYPSEGRAEYFAAHLLYRAQIYVMLGDLLGAPYVADPIRSPIVRTLNRNAKESFSAIVIGALEESESQREHRLDKLLGRRAFSAQIPLVFRHVLRRASSAEELLEATMDVRDSSHARRFRQFCSQVDEAVAEGNIDLVERALRDLTAAGFRLDDSLSERNSPVAHGILDASKEVVSLASPTFGALIPLLKNSADILPRIRSRFRLAFLDDVRRTPRTLRGLEVEFESAWPSRT
jgi:hypothetical protein